MTTELEAAWRSADALGAVPLRTQLETLARRARISLVPSAEAEATDGSEVEAPGTGRRGPSATRPATHNLSAREVEVLRLVAAGRSNGEIAEELFITRKTAGVHVTHILDKMGVSNRVEAAMAGVRLGLVSGEADDGEEGTGTRA